MHVRLGELTLKGAHRLLCIALIQPYPKGAMLKMLHEGASLVVQWLRIYLPM